MLCDYYHRHEALGCSERVSGPCLSLACAPAHLCATLPAACSSRSVRPISSHDGRNNTKDVCTLSCLSILTQPSARSNDGILICEVPALHAHALPCRGAAAAADAYRRCAHPPVVHAAPVRLISSPCPLHAVAQRPTFTRRREPLRALPVAISLSPSPALPVMVRVFSRLDDALCEICDSLRGLRRPCPVLIKTLSAVGLEDRTC